VPRNYVSLQPKPPISFNPSGSYHFVRVTCSGKCYSASPPRSRFFCSALAFSTACAVPCATPSVPQEQAWPYSVVPEQATAGQATAGQKTLEYLEHTNLFIVPLDNERRWYRYHHLFGDLLLTPVKNCALPAETKGPVRRLLDLLGNVLAKAEPKCFIRLFVDEGNQMAELLSDAAARGIRTDYIHKLLAAFAMETKEQEPTTSVPVGSSLVEPLSPRKLEVLGLIAQGLSNQ
jgi:hypothetical protein